MLVGPLVAGGEENHVGLIPAVDGLSVPFGCWTVSGHGHERRDHQNQGYDPQFFNDFLWVQNRATVPAHVRTRRKMAAISGSEAIAKWA